jgi:hypothetical protein
MSPARLSGPPPRRRAVREWWARAVSTRSPGLFFAALWGCSTVMGMIVYLAEL